MELQSGCTLITSESINAFTTGLVNAKAYITSGLNDQLNSQESHVVQLHELAHVTHSDPLKKYVFSLFASFYASKLSDKLNRSYSLALEKLADEAVQKEILDVTLLTKTMIKVSRLQLSEKNDFKFRVLQGECSFTENPLESRIYYALNERKGSDFPVLSVFTLVIIIAALSTLSVDLLHHSIEQIFAH